MFWHSLMRHCSFRGFVQQKITHGKSHAAATSLSFNFKGATLLSRWREGGKICACCRHLKASFSERCVLLFKGLLILCDFLWSGTAAAADNWNKKSKENKEFLPEADSTREKKQRFDGFSVALCVCVLKKNPCGSAAVVSKQCMYSKGSECKPMLSKLKSQFEELKSKVVFLDCVKKYLEVLRNLYDSLLFAILCLITSICWYNSHIFPDSECGPVGVRGFITAFSGWLWLWLSGSPILPGSVCSVLWHQQREEHSASWLSPGPHGLPLCQVLLLRI